jgi:hypothetical protein
MQPSCGRPAITWVVNRHNRMMVGVQRRDVIYLTIFETVQILSSRLEIKTARRSELWRAVSL